MMIETLFYPLVIATKNFYFPLFSCPSAPWPGCSRPRESKSVAKWLVKGIKSWKFSSVAQNEEGGDGRRRRSAQNKTHTQKLQRKRKRLSRNIFFCQCTTTTSTDTYHIRMYCTVHECVCVCCVRKPEKTLYHSPFNTAAAAAKALHVVCKNPRRGKIWRIKSQRNDLLRISGEKQK